MYKTNVAGHFCVYNKIISVSIHYYKVVNGKIWKNAKFLLYELTQPVTARWCQTFSPWEQICHHQRWRDGKTNIYRSEPPSPTPCAIYPSPRPLATSPSPTPLATSAPVPAPAPAPFPAPGPSLQGTGCEMYTETLSSSFIGMTFARAAEICFVKVQYRAFHVSSIFPLFQLKLLIIAIELTNSEGKTEIAVNPQKVRIANETVG